MGTNVYVDGFNLYYGALKGSPYKWLNIAELCALLLPNHKINRIRYFTANVSATPSDPNCHVRQQTYLRALASIPNLSIHRGHFQRMPKWMPLVNPTPGQKPLALVWKIEEKGSDVSLGAHLVHDAHCGDFDKAVIISNDSDLLEPLKIVRYQIGFDVGVLNPHAKPAKQLQIHATFMKQIRQGPLGASQFPVSFSDAHGTITKPTAW